jgi:hypothetical protein
MTGEQLTSGGSELCLLTAVDDVGRIIANHGTVGGHYQNFQLVYLEELLTFGDGRSTHTSQLLVHAKVVLDGHCCRCYIARAHLNVFFGLDGLMQALVRQVDASLFLVQLKVDVWLEPACDGSKTAIVLDRFA